MSQTTNEDQDAIALTEDAIEKLSDEVRDKTSFTKVMYKIFTSYIEVPFNLELLDLLFQHCYDTFQDFPAVFNDCVNNLLLIYTNTDQRQKISEICSHLVYLKHVTSQELAQALPPDFSSLLKLIDRDDHILVPARRYFTNTFYKQKIFNLMREETQGFSILIDCIYSLPEYSNDENPSFIERVMELTGAYDINPIRILDAVLLVFPYHIVDHKQIYINFIKSLPLFKYSSGSKQYFYSRTLLTNLVGSRLKQSYEEEKTPQNKSTVRLSSEFYLMIAVFIQEDLIDFDQILTQIFPCEKSEEIDFKTELRRENRKMSTWKPDNALSQNISLDRMIQQDRDRNDSYSRRNEGKGSSNLSFTAGYKLRYKPNYKHEHQVSKLLEAIIFSGDIERIEFIIMKYEKILSYSKISGFFLAKIIRKMIEDRFPQSLAEFAIVSGDSEGSESTPDYSIDPLYTDATQLKVFPNALHNLEKFPVDPIPFSDKLKYWLKVIDIYIGHNVPVLADLLKLSKDIILSNDQNDELKQIYTDIFLDYILPAYSFGSSTTPLAQDIWDILKSFDQDKRYQIYTCWKESLKKADSDLQYRVQQATFKITNVTKVILMSTAPKHGNVFNKLILSCPFPCLLSLIKKITEFDGIIPAISESFKRLDEMSLDLFNYMLIDFLTNDCKTQSYYSTDQVNMDKWYQCLSKFVAMTHRRVIKWDLKPLLVLIADRLVEGKMEYMYMLTSILNYLIGIDFSQSSSDAEIRAMSAGPKFKAFKLKFESQSDIEFLTNRKSKEKWSLALHSIPHLSTLIPLILNQSLQKMVYSLDSNLSVGVTSDRYDTYWTMFHLFVDILHDHSNIRQSHFESLPPLGTLISELGIDSATSFFLLRPRIIAKIKELDETNSNTDDQNIIPPTNRFNDVILPALQPILGDIKSAITENAQTTLGLRFYIEFFSLTLRDIYYDRAGYQDLINQLKDEKINLDEEIKGYEELKTNNEYNEKYIKAKTRSNLIGPDIKILEMEMNQQRKEHAESTRKIKGLVDTWFHSEQQSNNAIRQKFATNFVQHCLVPRILLSASDAMFCAIFIKRLHEFKAPDFPIYFIIDEFFKVVKPLLRTYTNLEVIQFGTFLNEILKFIKSGHQSESHYNTHFIDSSHSGFISNWSDSKLPKLTYKEFSKQVQNWHIMLHDIIDEAINTEEDHYISNIVAMLGSIREEFPALHDHTSKNFKSFKDYLDISGATESNKIRVFSDHLESMLPTMVTQDDFLRGIYKNTTNSQTNDQDEATNDRSSNINGRAERSERGERLERVLSSTSQTGRGTESRNDSDRERNSRNNRSQGMHSDRQNVSGSGLRSAAQTNAIHLTGDPLATRRNDSSPQITNLRDNRHDNNQSPRNSRVRQREEHDDHYQMNQQQNGFNQMPDRRRMRQDMIDQRQSFSNHIQNHINDNRQNDRDRLRDTPRRAQSPARRRDNRQRH